MPVTAETLYPMASTTKAVTGTLLGMLVDEGLIGWDVPVRRCLPRFEANSDSWLFRIE
jgi:CubicO group peptidase (beta-lactamase class C family)